MATAPAPIVHTSKAAGVNGGTTSAIDTTGCSSIYIYVSWFSAAITVSDSQSNTWTGLTETSSGGLKGRWYYCDNPTTNAAHTFTVSGTNIYCSFAVVGLKGTLTSGSADQQNGSATATPGSVTPSTNDQTVLQGISHDNTGAETISAGYYIMEQQTFSAGAREGVAIAFLPQGTAAATNPTWTGGATFVTRAVTVKSAASGGGASPVGLGSPVVRAA